MSVAARTTVVCDGRPPRWECERNEQWLRAPRGTFRVLDSGPSMENRWFLCEFMPDHSVLPLGNFSQESEARLQAEMHLTVRVLREPVAVRDHLSRHAAEEHLLGHLMAPWPVSLYNGNGRQAVETLMGRLGSGDSLPLAPGAGLPYLPRRFWRWLQVLGCVEGLLAHLGSPYPLLRLLVSEALADARLLGVAIDYCADHDLATTGEWLCDCREMVLADNLPRRLTLATTATHPDPGGA